MCRTIPIRGGPIFFRRTCRVECPLKAAFCRDNGEERRQVASGTKEDVFAALTDIENTEKIYLDNGVYKRNTTLRSSWDLRIVHEGDQQVSGHGEGGPQECRWICPYLFPISRIFAKETYIRS